jgi:catechol 2,3-dioxygenase-like lactoylglutathione lyase family enzyme
MNDNLNEFGITHLRHVDLAIPDYDQQHRFYTETWGLSEVGSDDDLTYLAAEGSPEQYVIRLRRANQKRLDLVAFGAESPTAVDSLAQRLGADGIQLVSEPGALQTAGGGYGFRFFDIDGRTIEISSDVEVRQHRPIEEGEAIPVRISHAVMNSSDPNATRDFYAQKLGFKLSDSLWSQHLGEMMHFMQRLASQPGHRQGPAHLAAPRVVRDAGSRRVHAWDRARDARRLQEGVGPGPSPRRQQHLLLLP